MKRIAVAIVLLSVAASAADEKPLVVKAFDIRDSGDFKEQKAKYVGKVVSLTGKISYQQTEGPGDRIAFPVNLIEVRTFKEIGPKTFKGRAKLYFKDSQTIKQTLEKGRLAGRGANPPTVTVEGKVFECGADRILLIEVSKIEFDWAAGPAPRPKRR